MNPSRKPRLIDSTFVRFGLKVLLVFSIIFVGSQIQFVFRPIVALVTTLFLPILVAGALYYLFVPVVRLLEQLRLPRVAAIIILYLVFLLLFTMIILIIAPTAARQVERLVENTPDLVEEARTFLNSLQENSFLQRFIPDQQDLELNIGQRVGDMLSEIYSEIDRNLNAFIGFLTGITIVLTVVPFILFFMLKDGHQLPEAIVRFFPSEYRPEGREILSRMSETLAAFVQGQIIVSLFVGTFIYIGYRIIGLEYALLMALVALVTNLIPYIGPIIGTVPGMFVGLLASPFTMLQVILLVVIVQQVESQLISPLVMGRKLNIHPLTVIFVLLTAGSLAGFLGLLLAVPSYAVGRTAAIHIYKLYALKVHSDQKIINP
ncbi:MAG: AI-2E family transporter [Spirochaeta sp.]